MREIIVSAVGSLIVVSGLVFLVLAMISALDYADCRGFERGTGLRTKWEFGCYALTEQGKWVPKKFAFGDAKELRIKEAR